MKVYCVNHMFGCSLIEAVSETSALTRARQMFGEYGSPYKLSENQEESIAWAKNMGAAVISC